MTSSLRFAFACATDKRMSVSNVRGVTGNVLLPSFDLNSQYAFARNSTAYGKKVNKTQTIYNEHYET